MSTRVNLVKDTERQHACPIQIFEWFSISVQYRRLFEIDLEFLYEITELVDETHQIKVVQLVRIRHTLRNLDKIVLLQQ
jgi:hypothetical protein